LIFSRKIYKQSKVEKVELSKVIPGGTTNHRITNFAPGKLPGVFFFPVYERADIKKASRKIAGRFQF